MPREDEFEDGDRSRRRPRDDEDDDDRPARSRRRRDEGDEEPSPRQKSGTGLIVGILVGVFVLCCGGGGTAVYFVVHGLKKGVEQIQQTVQTAQDSQMSEDNLRQIGTAIHKYNDVNNSLPNNSYEVRGGQTRPLLSWRVHILPYLNQDALYKQFKLDEPWDSATNKPLLARMPPVFATIDARNKAGDGKTYYRGFSQAGAMFEKPAFPGAPVPRIKLVEVPDGASNTILVVEAGEPVEWTRPDDLDWSPGKPRPALGYSGPEWKLLTVLMVDGTRKQIRKDLPDETLRRLITRNDGMIIPAGWDNPNVR